MPTPRQPRLFTVIGWILTALPLLALGVGSLATYVIHPEQMTQGAVHLGYPEHVVQLLFALELGFAILYAIPQTAVLGAILITAYLGGAVASHIRIGETQFIIPLILAIITWLALYFRDPRLRALIPLRTA